ncbi:hypothetical protein [Pasteurella canis]|uniref:hypothetical protein n=1 Tax=Pasteurella canis TaxID=753 RepID=UPI00132B1D9F|nr:hypothetical protein [Pasteurella canis]MXN87578.1 hypothetical protein [Pasteurella canis]
MQKKKYNSTLPDNSKHAEVLRENIKNTIRFMGITQKEASDIISEEIGKDNFYESFKKILQRCKNIKKLEYYLSILKECEKYRIVSNSVIKHIGDEKILGKENLVFLHKMSEEISMSIDDKETSIREMYT